MIQSRTRGKKLTQGQAAILHLFDREMSEVELEEVNDLLSKHFYTKAQAEADKYLLNHKLSPKKLKETVEKLNTNRSSTKQKLLKKSK